MTSAKPSRTRPTNNQLLYKAHFRWSHYPQIRHASDFDLPNETEACASVTSAFLQVLSTLYAAENVRGDRDRNILELLSNNTRRTKVVELSSGTHRVPDELKRHSLTDKAGSQYSTNLDRNRYGTDNQYLSTVIRYDLDYLNLCPCLVDVEIIDAKNGSGTVIVSAGDHACGCTSQVPPVGKRLDRRQQDSVLQGSLGHCQKDPAAGAAAAATAGDADISSDETHPQPALKAEVADIPPAFAAPSKSGGSELFDALLMAATGGTETTARGISTGEPPVNSKQSGGMPRPRSRLWHQHGTSAGEADSLQNAVNAFAVEEEIASGPHELESSFARTGPRSARGQRPCTPIPRRGSASNMLDQSASQDGVHPASAGRAFAPHGGRSIAPARALGSSRWSPTAESVEDVNGCKAEEADRSGDEGATLSLHSQEGDTEAAHMAMDEEPPYIGGKGMGPRRARGSKSNLLQGVGRQSSAVNLTKLGRDSDLKRLIDEVRMMKEERAAVEGALEEARSRELEQRSRADSLKQEVEAQRSQVQRHLTQMSALRADVVRLTHGKRGAEARAVAAETAAQQCQQELAALKMLTASMLAHPHPPGAAFPELEGTESVKPGCTVQASNSVVDTLTQQQGSRGLEDAPSSGNFWSQVPSASNIQSSQSSVLDGLGSASLPIDQLQLKAGTSFPRLSAPQSTSALSAPFWGSASVDSNIQLPVGAVGIQAGSYGIQSSPQLPQGGSLQMPWLTAWSQSIPVTVAEPMPLSKEISTAEPPLKRSRDHSENGEPVDSKPSKRAASDHKIQPDRVKHALGSSAAREPVKGMHETVNGQAESAKQGPSAGLDSDSPNTSSHSSSPEAGALRPGSKAVPAQG